MVDPIGAESGGGAPAGGGESAGGGEQVRKRFTTCEFCECKLTHDGEILKVSERAQTFRDHDYIVKGLHREIKELKTQLEAEKAAHAPASSARTDDDDLLS